MASKQGEQLENKWRQHKEDLNLAKDVGDRGQVGRGTAVTREVWAPEETRAGAIISRPGSGLEGGSSRPSARGLEEQQGERGQRWREAQAGVSFRWCGQR